ncbi:hypothetical protein T265_11325 [Opisthorchis viverrini]|uniref:Uncharacterized protein n=1 Tax=Opisthorchis viverrini TaxID=6198 RepID=A0A074YZE1_OPIVI|nr:hypothetical protein T265_11325 [Opisthorchis viverrini]KER20043.1 hypothetical protein T265_11325 [Opisthorchis viverrini]
MNFFLKLDCTVVAPFRCLVSIPMEGGIRTRIEPCCPSLDKSSRDAEVGLERRTYRSTSWHLSQNLEELLKNNDQQLSYTWILERFLALFNPDTKRCDSSCPTANVIIIIDSMASLFNTDASLSHNHDLFESLVVEKRVKVDGEGISC